MFGWSAKERARAETHDAPLVLLALGGALHTGRDGAMHKRVLVEHDYQISLLMYQKKTLLVSQNNFSKHIFQILMKHEVRKKKKREIVAELHVSLFSFSFSLRISISSHLSLFSCQNLFTSVSPLVSISLLMSLSLSLLICPSHQVYLAKMVRDMHQKGRIVFLEGSTLLGEAGP